MKHRKSIGTTRSLVIAAAGILFVSGCGASTTSEEDGSTSEGGEIVVGMLAPLTGGAAVTGEQMVNVAKLAVQQINEEAGADGCKISLKVYDDKLTADDAAQAAQRAITVDDAGAIVGTLASASALAARVITERSKTPLLVPAASAVELTEGADHVFRVTVNAKKLAQSTIEVAGPLGVESVAILYDNGAVGQTYFKFAKERAEELGLDVTGIQYSTGAASMSTFVQKAAQSDPGAVMIAGSSGADYGLIAKAMVEQGLLVPVMGLTTMAGPDAVSVAGDAYSKLPGLYVTLARDTESPAYQEFLDAYAAEYPDDESAPNDFALQTYDAFQLLESALDASDCEGGQALTDALEKTELTEAVSVPEDAAISFDEAHEGFASVSLQIYEIVDGNLQPSELTFSG